MYDHMCGHHSITTLTQTVSHHSHPSRWTWPFARVPGLGEQRRALHKDACTCAAGPHRLHLWVSALQSLASALSLDQPRGCWEMSREPRPWQLQLPGQGRAASPWQVAGSSPRPAPLSPDPVASPLLTPYKKGKGNVNEIFCGVPTARKTLGLIRHTRELLQATRE